MKHIFDELSERGKGPLNPDEAPRYSGLSVGVPSK